MICNAIDGNANGCYYSKQFPRKQWIKIKINQVHSESKYVYRIYINDEEVFKANNTRPAYFGNLKVYAGDPWYASQAGYIRNLQISGK